MSRRVRVHAFLAAATVSQSGSHPTSNLLGVDYWYEVPADAEFPRLIGRLDLFSRLYLERAKETEFFVSIRWLDSPTKQGRQAVRFGPFRVNFQRHEVVRDHVFRVINIRLQGVGRYSIRLIREAQPNWRGQRFVVLGETGFYVQR
ncbi:MAG: hypothetical protein L0241_05465 [Planctomycetia bacterium]|nr:hypothetical protein [Planctomycetia bacterium]